MRILLFGNYNGGKQFYDELSEWLTKVTQRVDLLYNFILKVEFIFGKQYYNL